MVRAQPNLTPNIAPKKIEMTPGKIDKMAEFAGVDLACVRAERPVFDRLGFALRPGGALRLTGANGSGKVHVGASSILRGSLLPAFATHDERRSKCT